MFLLPWYFNGQLHVSLTKRNRALSMTALDKLLSDFASHSQSNMSFLKLSWSWIYNLTNESQTASQITWFCLLSHAFSHEVSQLWRRLHTKERLGLQASKKHWCVAVVYQAVVSYFDLIIQKILVIPDLSNMLSLSPGKYAQ